MAKDSFGYGTDQKSKISRLLSGEQIAFSDKLMKKSFSEDELTYFELKEAIGEKGIEKLTKIFVEKYVSKNPELQLSDLNNFLISVAMPKDYKPRKR